MVPPAEAEAEYWASHTTVRYDQHHVPAGVGAN